jgi:D-3-phosphoglycerate dehydrogenase
VTISSSNGAADAAARRVLITTVPFGQCDARPLDLLRQAGIGVVTNPLGRRLQEHELAELAKDFGILIAGTEPITAAVMRNAPRLRLIARVGIGLDNVDLVEAHARGIDVTYTPDAPAPAVAELTIGLMLGLLRDIPGADRRLRHGTWQRSLGRRIGELTVGVIGVGRVGRRVIRHLGGGFPGVRIMANDLRPDAEFGHAHGVCWADKDTLYREADLITLHVPLTPATRRLISAREMAQMKPGVLLVNTSRGNMIDEADLATALRAGRVAGAAIDVFEREPYTGELTGIEQCILTCHMGSMSEDCRGQMELEAAEEVVRFSRGEALLREVPEDEFLRAQRI